MGRQVRQMKQQVRTGAQDAQEAKFASRAFASGSLRIAKKAKQDISKAVQILVNKSEKKDERKVRKQANETKQKVIKLASAPKRKQMEQKTLRKVANSVLSRSKQKAKKLKQRVKNEKKKLSLKKRQIADIKKESVPRKVKNDILKDVRLDEGTIAMHLRQSRKADKAAEAAVRLLTNVNKLAKDKKKPASLSPAQNKTLKKLKNKAKKLQHKLKSDVQADHTKEKRAAAAKANRSKVREHRLMESDKQQLSNAARLAKVAHGKLAKATSRSGVRHALRTLRKSLRKVKRVKRNQAKIIKKLTNRAKGKKLSSSQIKTLEAKLKKLTAKAKAKLARLHEGGNLDDVK